MRARFINESTLDDFDYSSIITDENKNFILSIRKEDYIYSYRYKNNISDNINDDEIENSKEFDEYFNNIIVEQIDDIYWNIKDCIDINGNIKIWRSILVNEKWIYNLKDGYSLGIYWSWKKSSAEPHWGYNTENKTGVLIESIVNENNINWEKTIINNVANEGEDEIQLKSNVIINISNLFINDKKININKIKNINFISK